MRHLLVAGVESQGGITRLDNPTVVLHLEAHQRKVRLRFRKVWLTVRCLALLELFWYPRVTQTEK